MSETCHDVMSKIPVSFFFLGCGLFRQLVKNILAATNAAEKCLSLKHAWWIFARVDIGRSLGSCQQLSRCPPAAPSPDMKVGL